MGPDDTVSPRRGKRAGSKESGKARMAGSSSVPPPDATVRETVRVAVSLHEGAPGGNHLDLFVGPVAPCAPELAAARCWRLPTAAWTPEGLAPGRFAVTPLAAHRAEYLELASPRTLSDDRGRVVPLQRGRGWMAGGQLAALGRTLAFSDDGWVEIRREPPPEDRS